MRRFRMVRRVGVLILVVAAVVAGAIFRRRIFTKIGLRATSSPPSVGWRGDGSGRYPDARPPLHWSSTRNVVWRTPMPERSNATPVPLGDRIFVTAEPDLLLAVRASDGSILWQRRIPVLEALNPVERRKAESVLHDAAALDRELPAAEAEYESLKRDARKEGAGPDLSKRIGVLEQSIASMRERAERAAHYSPKPDGTFVGYASQTPVTDGRSVFVALGSLVVASFDLDGNRRWIRYLPQDVPRGDPNGDHNRIGASPILAGGHLIVPMIDLYGLDADTGDIDWSIPEYRSWGTPVRVRWGGRDALATPTGSVLDAGTGSVLATFPVPARFTGPAVDGQMLVFAGPNSDSDTEREKQFAAAFEIPLAGSQPQRRWMVRLGNGSFSGTPVLGSGRMFALDGSTFVVVDADNGQILLRRPLRLTGLTIPSPAIAGDHLFLSSETGETEVLSASPPYEAEALNPFEDEMHASLVFVGQRMFARTFKYLYCISEAEPASPATAAPGTPR